MTKFVDEAARFTSKVSFAEVAEQSLREIFGESPTAAVLYHVGGVGSLRDPEVLEERLKAIFGVGAEMLLNCILKNLDICSKAKDAENR